MQETSSSILQEESRPVEKLSHRRSLANTVSTASSSSWSDYSVESVPSPTHSASADTLVQMIAKEMMAGLAKNEHGMNQSYENFRLTGDDTHELVNDLHSLARLMMKNTDIATVEKPDQMLRKLLRESFKQEEESENQECGSNFLDSPTRTSNSSASGATLSSSEFSGLSMNQKPSKVPSNSESPMDIWHPQFWDKNTPNDNEEGESRAFTDSSRETFTRTDSSAGHSEGKSISEFVKTLEAVTSDSDSDSSSTVSDISGLTGVFTDFGVDRDTRSRSRHKKSTPIATIAAKAPALIKGKKAKTKGRKIEYCVTFKDVIVREYSVEMAYNPGCLAGPAIGLGWQYNILDPVSVDDWEFHRRISRKGSQLLIARHEREDILRRWGFTDSQVAGLVRELNKLRNQRRQTVNNLGACKMEEAVEAARGKMKRLFFMKGKDVQTEY